MNVLITGGASGIGLAIARRFDEGEAQVRVCDVNEELVSAFNSEHGRMRAFVADVGDEAEVERLFGAVLGDFGGRLDVLVNNAGIAGPNGPLEELNVRDFHETLRVNLVSAFLCSRQALPVMKRQRGGCIVNLSSTAGILGFPLRTPYASAKWGIIGLTKSLAMEVGPYGIRVNAICPGSVRGPRIDRVIEAEARTRGIPADEVRRRYESQVSMKRFVEAEDIANMAHFICSDSGANISGQALTVDGHTETLGQF